MEAHDQAVLEALDPLREAGFALHWLHPRTKRPIGNEWQKEPVASLADLRRTHATGNNLGVRTGEPSAMAAGGYLYILDLDIRIAELAEEAWARFAELFPGLDRASLPEVVSGAGGESRHLYLIADKPFWSKKLAVSGDKFRSPDGRWRYTWEIELFGTNKQVALPPSIHPDTGQPYRWLRPFDFSALDLGLGPFVPSAVIEHLAVAEATTYEFESREPLTFEPGQLERDLDDIPLDRIDDYHDWVLLGQALHHQFGASQEGFDLWVEHSKRSEKFDGSNSGLRTMRSKWRGFGRNRKQPVTMGTVRQWAIDARRARLIAQFDEEPEEDAFDEVAERRNSSPAGQSGAAEVRTTPLHPPSVINVDDLLGGPAELDPIDAVGTEDAAQSEPAIPDWMSLLDFNEEGAIRPTLHNVELIVRNDARLSGVPQLNEFTQETVQRRVPSRRAARRRNAAKPMIQLEGQIWHVRDALNGDLWSDDRDFSIRAMLEAPKTQGGYGLKVSDRDLKAAVVLAASRNAFHPVREYLTGLAWDGRPRVETLFIDYLGSPDTPYHRDAARMMMAAAVCRVFEPGHKFDFAVILEGVQGKRKSTFIRTLGRRWYAELDGDFHDAKEMIELMQGAWILEIPELSGFSRADVRAIKAFMSRQADRARLAYARRAGSFPRQCIFIGSTNDREYLKDNTGGRRFWPIACTVDEIDTEKLAHNVDQLWAEALVLYRAMRMAQPAGTLPLYLDGAALREAQGIQESRRVETEVDAMAGIIAAWLDKPLSTGNFDDDVDDLGKPRLRLETCLAEIWCECLGNDLKAYHRPSALMLGEAMRLVEGWDLAGSKVFPRYAKQKLYFRGGRTARARMVTAGSPTKIVEIGLAAAA
jgi:hypothetical protein